MQSPTEDDGHSVNDAFKNIKPPLPYHYNVPPPNENYFARNEILRALQDTLRTSPDSNDLSQRDRIRTFALCGDVGSGKTQIACHFVNSHEAEYDAIFWIRADDVDKLWIAYEEISNELGLRSIGDARDMLARRDILKSWLAHCSTSPSSNQQITRRVRWLIVFENVENPDLLKDFWPENGAGDILVTSRHPLTKTANFFGQLGIDVEPFDTRMSIEFLTQLTGSSGSPDQTLAAARIAEVLGGMPLALVSASHLINQGSLTLDEGCIDQIYRTRDTLSQASYFQSNEHKVYDHVESVIFVALEKLTVGSCLIDVLAILEPDGIKEEMLRRGAPYINLQGFPKTLCAWDAAKSELLKPSLININGGEIEIHRVIQDVAKARMGIQRLTEVYEAAIGMFSQLWPRPSLLELHEISRWGKSATLLPHILRLHQYHEGNVQLDLSPRSSFQFAELMSEASWYVL